MSGEDLKNAVCENNFLKVNEYLQNGIDVNYVDEDDGWTCLLWAVKKQHVECVKILLENGANTNLQDQSGNTALHKAAYTGSTECIQLLLNHGANLLARNNMNQSPYELAEIFGRESVLTLLKGATTTASLTGTSDSTKKKA